MQVIYFSNGITALIDTVLWFLIHMGMAVGMTKLPVQVFNENFFIFRDFKWEKKGTFYDKLCKVTLWKNLIPDGAAWFHKGFAKKKLQKNNPEYFLRFAKESCRGELTHWLVIFCSPLFFLFNPIWAGWIMVGYACTANLPCIIIQRYNRPRLKRVYEKRAYRNAL